jgi:hypothetical protein
VVTSTTAVLYINCVVYLFFTYQKTFPDGYNNNRNIAAADRVYKYQTNTMVLNPGSVIEYRTMMMRECNRLPDDRKKKKKKQEAPIKNIIHNHCHRRSSSPSPSSLRLREHNICIYPSIITSTATGIESRHDQFCFGFSQRAFRPVRARTCAGPM